MFSLLIVFYRQIQLSSNYCTVAFEPNSTISYIIRCRSEFLFGPSPHGIFNILYSPNIHYICMFKTNVFFFVAMRVGSVLPNVQVWISCPHFLAKGASRPPSRSAFVGNVQSDCEIIASHYWSLTWTNEKRATTTEKYSNHTDRIENL